MINLSPIADALALVRESRVKLIEANAVANLLGDSCIRGPLPWTTAQKEAYDAAIAFEKGPQSAAFNAEADAESALVGSLRTAGLRAAVVGDTLVVDPRGLVSIADASDPWYEVKVLLIPVAETALEGGGD